MPAELNCFPAAYNAPANISLRNCPWGINVTASFLYWHVSQSGMFAAVREPSLIGTSGTLVSPSFKYKPGFKVGLGFNTDFDDWTGKLEYTWMHQRTSSSSTAEITAPFSSLNWAVPNYASDFSFLSLDTKWKMNMDRLDLVFSRPYYQGQRLTIAPVGGLRGQWIRQSYQFVTDDPIGGQFDLTGTTNVHSHSWAVGPVAGATTNWLLGSGFRLEGKAEGALLYTRYTKVSQNQSIGINFNSIPLLESSASIGSYGTLRPMAELGVGFGWGSYFGCQDFYFDLSARYDFNVLWDQNVMVSFVNAMNRVPGTSGDLYLHGLTLTARFDF